MLRQNVHAVDPTSRSAGAGHMQPVNSVTRYGVPLRITERWIRPGARRRPAVVLYPRLHANKESLDAEARSLMENGFAAVVVDPPHHGYRRSPLLDEMARATGDDAHRIFLRIIHEARQEAQLLCYQLIGRGHPWVGIAGISLGAFIALCTAFDEPNYNAVVSILGSPNLKPTSGVVPDDMRYLVDDNPMREVMRFRYRPMFLATAGGDEQAPPEASRRLYEMLQCVHECRRECFVYREYPESGQWMRDEDWHDVWQSALEFLRKAIEPHGRLVR
jgi:alpha-beta hydrolase superfamily lysophospholipase